MASLFARFFPTSAGRPCIRRFCQSQTRDSDKITSAVQSSKSQNRNVNEFSGGRRKEEIDLFKMDQRQFQHRVLGMADDEWLRYQRAFARTDGYEQVTDLRTLRLASKRAADWLKNYSSRASVAHFADNVLVQAKYLSQFHGYRDSNMARNGQYCLWLRRNLKKLSTEEFFLVIASFEEMGANQTDRLFSDDIVKLISYACRRFATQAKLHQLSSLFRTIRLHCPSIDSVSPGTSACLWTELRRKGLPTEADDLFLTLKSLTEPIALSLSERGGKEFPFRPPVDEQLWFRQLIQQPFSKKLFENSRPLSLMAAVGLLGKASGPLVPFSNEQLQSFALQTAQPYHSDPSIVFKQGKQGLFGKILDCFRTLAWVTDNSKLVSVREKLLQHNVAFNELFWADFWLTMDKECRTLPLHVVVRLYNSILQSTRIHHQQAEKLLTYPFPATSFAWIDHCLDRCTEMPHPDDLFHVLLHSWSDDAQLSTKRRLLESIRQLDPMNPTRKQKWIQRMNALEKSINQMDNGGKTTAIERLRDATKILQTDMNRMGEIDFPSLHQSMDHYMPDLHQSTVVRDFMTALLSRPEAVEYISQPQNWLFLCYRLYMAGNTRMRPGVAWWKALCTKLQKDGSFPEKHVYRFLDSYLKLTLAYPDYPLPAVVFDSLERIISSVNSPSVVVNHIHQLHLIRLRDEALVRLAEERLFALTEKGDQQLQVVSLIDFLTATTSLNVALRRNWWKHFDAVSRKPVPMKPVVLFTLLDAAVLQEILFVKGSVPVTLVSWALKKLIAESKIGYDELYDCVNLHRLLLVFGDKAIADAHPDLLAYVKNTPRQRLRSSGAMNTLIYVKEADAWVSNVDHRQKRCQLVPPSKCYYKRDGTRDDSVLFADFAAVVALLKAADFDVQLVNSRGRPVDLKLQ